MEVVIRLLMVMALISGQSHPAIPDDRGEIGQDHKGENEKPEFSAAGASGEICIVSERPLEKRPEVTPGHMITFIGWLVPLAVTRMTIAG